MQSIYKYTLGGGKNESLQIPLGGRFLSVQVQRGEITLWFLIDKNVFIPERRFFSCYMTGEDISTDDKDVFLGTVQLMQGDFVLHVFEHTS